MASSPPPPRCALDVLSDSDCVHAVHLATTIYLPLRQLSGLSDTEWRQVVEDGLRDYLSPESSSVRRAIGLASVVSVLPLKPAALVQQGLVDIWAAFPVHLEEEEEDEAVGGKKSRRGIQHREEARVWGRLECQFRQQQLLLARHCCGRLAGGEPTAALLEYATQSLGKVFAMPISR